VEKMEMTHTTNLVSAFSGRSVFLTGHTGFKGSWLALWLSRLGARVHGYALAPNTAPSMFNVAGIQDLLASHVVADVRDAGALRSAMDAASPDIVFHLAAQPLVRASYRDPVETWSTNVMGTVHLLEAIRSCPSVKTAVVVTTDKCYQNQERSAPYSEDDPLGGNDPYSASKAGTELVVNSYRKSFFSKGGPLIASVRAGNVIGGGDWSEDRLIPDAARAVANHVPLLIRNPGATRPWQHVLEALHGYLLLASRLIGGESKFADAFNFGPDAEDNRTVAEVLSRMQRHWPELAWELDPGAASAPHEAHLLHLDSSKAHRALGWTPRWNLETGIEKTAEWYRRVLNNPLEAADISARQLDEFLA
jgi:CDP-glucose 4,6-dehydratase